MWGQGIVNTRERNIRHGFKESAYTGQIHNKLVVTCALLLRYLNSINLYILQVKAGIEPKSLHFFIVHFYCFDIYPP